MSETLRRVQALVLGGDVRISDHGYDELGEDGILAEDAIVGIAAAELVEDYPDRARGPSVLALQFDAAGQAIHVVCRRTAPSGFGDRLSARSRLMG